MTYVLDASLTLAWCFEDEVSEKSERLLYLMQDGGAIVPSIWPVEVANSLLVAERRSRLTAAKASEDIELLLQLPISIDLGNLDRALNVIRPLALRHNLSVYDASYLELAARTGLPLGTLDARLTAAAVQIGVTTL